jgi:hygromycin-B 7''-O-kinase
MPPLLPDCPTKQAFFALVAGPEPWLPAARHLAERHGLATPGPGDHRRAGAVVFLLGDRVLKFIPRWWEGEITAERTSLPVVHGRLGIETPAVVAEGEIEGWPYLVTTRIPGRELGDLLGRVPVEDRCAMAAAVGEALSRMHALPTGGFAGLPVHGPEFERTRREVAPGRQREWGLPEALCAELRERLASDGPLLGPGFRPVPVHADLHHENLVVEERGGRWRATGIIDFGDAALGPPEFDLGVPALFLGGGVPAVLDALFAAYGIPGARRDPAFRRRLLLWMFLHPFGDMTRFLSRGEGRPSRTTLGEFEADLLPS